MVDNSAHEPYNIVGLNVQLKAIGQKMNISAPFLTTDKCSAALKLMLLDFSE